MSEQISKMDEHIAYLGNTIGYSPNNFDSKEDEMEFLQKNLIVIEFAHVVYKKFKNQWKGIMLFQTSNRIKMQLLVLNAVAAVRELLIIESSYGIEYQYHPVKDIRNEIMQWGSFFHSFEEYIID